MLHKVPELFIAPTVAVVCIMALLSVGIAELLADSMEQPPIEMLQLEAEGAIVSLRDFAMPNYWLWYHGADIPKVMQSLGRVDLYPLIVLTLYNACICSWLVAMGQVALSMFLAVRRLHRRSVWNWIWCVAMIGLAADLVEDLCLLVILINHPMAEYPTLNELTAWSSLLKYVAWLILGVFDVALGVPLALRMLTSTSVAPRGSGSRARCGPPGRT